MVLLTWIVYLYAGSEQIEANPFIHNYSAKEYGAFPQNWGIAQDARGMIYAANNDGILEYDGRQWRKIDIPEAGVIRSIAADARGRIFIGGRGEFGYLQPTRRGELQYHSLSAELDSTYCQFTDIWKIEIFEDMIYFYSKEILFRHVNEVGTYSIPLAKGFLFVLS